MRNMMLLPLCGLALAACGNGERVNPPTEPAQAIETPDVVSPTAAGSAGASGLLPGTGPASFVGRWAANVSWCAAPQGDRRPIEITTTRFEGYENSCDITAIDQVPGAYEATRRCVSEGTTTTDRVRMAVTAQILTLTYLDQAGTDPVTLRKCTTLGDTSPHAPALPTP